MTKPGGMDRKAIREQLREWFASRLGAAGLQGGEPLFETGILDSMNVLELAMHLETSFGLRVGPFDMVQTNFRTLDEITTYVERMRHT